MRNLEGQAVAQLQMQFRCNQPVNNLLRLHEKLLQTRQQHAKQVALLQQELQKQGALQLEQQQHLQQQQQLLQASEHCAAKSAGEAAKHKALHEQAQEKLVVLAAGMESSKVNSELLEQEVLKMQCRLEQQVAQLNEKQEQIEQLQQQLQKAEQQSVEQGVAAGRAAELEQLVLQQHSLLQEQQQRLEMLYMQLTPAAAGAALEMNRVG
jgi:chromosome segregation ATPase